MALISIDIDGVLSDFTRAASEVARSVGAYVPSGYQPSDWYWTDTLTKDDWKNIWAEIDDTPDFWVTCHPYPENVQALKSWLDANPEQRVFFITNRRETIGKNAKWQSELQLEKFGVWPRDGRSNVITVSDPKIKAKLMQRLGIQFSIDDYAPTVELCQEIPGHHAYLLDRPWNQKAKLPRVYSMAEFVKTVDALKGVKFS